MTANLAEPLRTAILNSVINSQLPAWLGSTTIFTRRPVPPNAPYPLVIVGPDISKQDEDGVADFRPILVRDISIYGLNDTPAHFRQVEDIAYMVHDLFHRKRDALVVSGWEVTGVVAMGPIPAPADDDQHIGRLVSLQIRLSQKL